MTIFEAAKGISCCEAAERLGLPGKRTGAARGVYSCPWHRDKTPSMVCYEGQNHFYCFSCGKHGDATDLYAMTLGLKPYQAAQRACEDFGLRWDKSDRSKSTKPALPVSASTEALGIVSLCRVWKRLQLKVAQDEIDAATQRLEQLQTPDRPGWNANLARAVQFQDEYNRVDAMTLGDILETIKEDFTAEREKEAQHGTH